MKHYAAILLALMLPVGVAAGMQQTSEQQHNHQQDKQRVDGVNERGDHAMGFSHEKTTHHFRLAADGGAIEVVANDPNDTASAEQIRAHLTHIAMLFKEGDFNIPMLVHGEAPPGVAAMKHLKGAISYTFESSDRGGRVRIATPNAEAIEAIHEFLRYQITDHQTGDPLETEKVASSGAKHSCAGMTGTCPFAPATRATDK